MAVPITPDDQDKADLEHRQWILFEFEHGTCPLQQSADFR
jgi:hypothetical protein